jgi:MFS family permease
LPKGKILADSTQKDKLWSVSFVIVIFISLFTSMLGNGLNNEVPVYIESIGGSAAFSGVLTSIFSFAAGVGRFVGGNLSDKYGRKKLIVFGAVLTTLGCAVSAIFITPAVLAACRLIQGLGFAITITAASAAAADMLPLSRMGEGIGYHSLAYALALACGVSMGVALFNWGSGIALFGGFAILACMTLILALVCRFEKWSDKTKQQVTLPGEEVNEAKLDPRVQPEQIDTPTDAVHQPSLSNSERGIWIFIEKTSLPVALVQLLFSFGTVLFTCFSALYAVHYGFEHVTLFFIAMAIAMVLTRLLCGKLFDRYSAPVLLTPGILLSIVACLLMLAFHTEITFCAAGFIYGLSAGLSMPVLTSEIVRRAPENRLGAGNATYWVSMDIAMTLGTLLWGFIIDAFGFDAILILSSAFLAFAVLTVVTLLRSTGPAGRNGKIAR